MNLYEIILHLEGKSYEVRQKEMKDMGVPRSLMFHINNCFNDSFLIHSTLKTLPYRLENADAYPD